MADNGAVFLCHGFHGVHKLLVFALRVVHDGHLGLGQTGQIVDFARMIHAQLDHAYAVAAAQTQQGQRHTNLVIQIALRGQGRIPCIGAQDAGNHLRDRGFAIAARHRDQGQGKLRAPSRSQSAQGTQAVLDLNAR